MIDDRIDTGRLVVLPLDLDDGFHVVPAGLDHVGILLPSSWSAFLSTLRMRLPRLPRQYFTFWYHDPFACCARTVRTVGERYPCQYRPPDRSARLQRIQYSHWDLLETAPISWVYVVTAWI